MLIKEFNILKDLEEQINKNNTLVIPEFQRNFAWTIDNVCELFDSIFFGHPIGAILTWKQTGESGLSYKNMKIKTLEENQKEGDICNFFCFHQELQNKSYKDSKINFEKTHILDGQQRIRSLYYGLLYPCHEEIYRPKRTKTNNCLYILTNDQDSDKTIHYDDIFNKSNYEKNYIILRDIQYSNDNSSLEIYFDFYESIGEDSRMNPIKWNFKVQKIDKKDIEIIGFIQNTDFTKPDHEQFDSIISKSILSIYLPTFSKILEPNHNLTSKSSNWDLWFQIFVRLSFLTKDSPQKAEFINFNMYFTTFMQWIDAMCTNLNNAKLANIQVDGSLSDMVVIFDKLNMTGVKLSTIDLLVAKTYTETPYFNLRKTLKENLEENDFVQFFDKKQELLSDREFLLFLKSISLIKKGDLREKLILELSKDDLTNVLIDNIEIFKKAINSTIEFMEAIPKINSILYVRYDLQLPILIALFYIIYEWYLKLLIRSYQTFSPVIFRSYVFQR
jgi:uncharacterized protein with ParB-like and HNH nuclease domain